MMTGPPSTLQEEEGDQDHAGAEQGEDLDKEIHGTSPPRRGSWLRLIVQLTARAAINPRLALDLVRLAWAFRSRTWYRTPPFLPLPDPEYTRWRMYTAYGDEQAVPPLQDVIRFARWRREVMGF